MSFREGPEITEHETASLTELEKAGDIEVGASTIVSALMANQRYKTAIERSVKPCLLSHGDGVFGLEDAMQVAWTAIWTDIKRKNRIPSEALAAAIGRRKCINVLGKRGQGNLVHGVKKMKSLQKEGVNTAARVDVEVFDGNRAKASRGNILNAVSREETAERVRTAVAELPKEMRAVVEERLGSVTDTASDVQSQAVGIKQELVFRKASQLLAVTCAPLAEDLPTKTIPEPTYVKMLQMLREGLPAAQIIARLNITYNDLAQMIRPATHALGFNKSRQCSPQRQLRSYLKDCDDERLAEVALKYKAKAAELRREKASRVHLLTVKLEQDSTLQPKYVQLFRLIQKGHTTRQIAEALGLKINIVARTTTLGAHALGLKPRDGTYNRQLSKYLGECSKRKFARFLLNFRKTDARIRLARKHGRPATVRAPYRPVYLDIVPMLKQGRKPIEISEKLKVSYTIVKVTVRVCARLLGIVNNGKRQTASRVSQALGSYNEAGMTEFLTQYKQEVLSEYPQRAKRQALKIADTSNEMLVA